MKLANVTTSQLEYLLAALNEPTWKDAAAAAGVSPPALSQGIAELERRLGVRLFDKQGRRRVPTAEAQDAAAYAVRILAEMREFTRWATEARGGGIGRLSIGMIDTAAIHHFGDTLVGFRSDRPGLTVQLQVQPSNTLLDQLHAGGLDAIVCVDPEATDRFTLEPLIKEPLYVYSPPGTKIGPTRDWGPWVTFPASSRTRALAARHLRAQGTRFDVVAESSQPAVLKEMVRLGMGWTVLSPVDAETGTHTLKRVGHEPIAERTLTLARRRDRAPSPALAALLAALRAKATQDKEPSSRG